MAKGCERIRHDLTHFRAVLDDQNDGVALLHRLLGPSFRLDRGVAERTRQVEPGGRAVPHLPIDLEVPARLLGQAIDHADAEAGSRSEEHTYAIPSLMRSTYADFCSQQ